jgi:transcriptional regulator
MKLAPAVRSGSFVANCYPKVGIEGNLLSNVVPSEILDRSIMYRPAFFREDRLDVMHGLIRAHPFAQLVTAGEQGLHANPLPMLIDPEASRRGTLRGHLARGNDQVTVLREGGEALVIFQGPQAYTSPPWYPGKAEHGKVVPTWNYVAVHAWGTPRVIDDPAWLRRLVGELTDAHERTRPNPWSVDVAPEDFIGVQLKAIVGIEIPIDRIDGKWKVSQNRSEPDRRGVVQGLRAEGDDVMADLVEGAL